MMLRKVTLLQSNLEAFIQMAAEDPILDVIIPSLQRSLDDIRIIRLKLIGTTMSNVTGLTEAVSNSRLTANIEIHHLNSRVLETVIYDHRRYVLGVKLRKGGVRLYRGIEPEVYQSLIINPSAGLRYQELQPLLGVPVWRLHPLWWQFRWLMRNRNRQLQEVKHV